MARPEKEYQRLPGRSSHSGIAVARKVRLWLGADHLLEVESTGWSEKYRRYFYRDIQSIIVRRTTRGLWISVILGAFCASIGGLAFYYRDIPEALVSLTTLATVFFILLLQNLLRGPTCQARITTPVGGNPLRSLNRLRPARKVLARVLPLIKQAQGPLPSAEIPQRLAAAAVPAFPEKQHAPAETASNYRGGIHRWVFGLLLGDAAITLLLIFHNSIPVYFLNLALTVSLALLTVIALVRQYRSLLPGSIHGLTWGTMSYIVVGLGIGYVQSIMTAIQNPRAAQNTWQMLKTQASQTASDSTFSFWLAIAAIVICLTIGLSGLLVLAAFNRAHDSRPTAA